MAVEGSSSDSVEEGDGGQPHQQGGGATLPDASGTIAQLTVATFHLGAEQ